jgi:1-phosphofructokinase
MIDVVTVTLNPAIDQTVWVEGLVVGGMNRTAVFRTTAGGKGVNVAGFLADGGVATAVSGFLGAENAELFTHFFAQKKITDAFIRWAGQTRTNVKVVDKLSQTTTELNHAGEAIPDTAVSALIPTLNSLHPRTGWFALCGNLPPGLPQNSYATLIEALHGRGQKILLDTSGSALAHGLAARPHIIKPNLLELGQLVGERVRGEVTAVLPIARQLQQTHGLELVVVSLAEAGAIFVAEQESWLAIPPAVPVQSSVGAGDALVAGLLWGLSQNYPLPEAARWATAWAAGAVGTIGANLPPAETLARYAAQVRVEPIG